MMAENIQTTPSLTIYKNDKVYDLSEFVQSMQITKSLKTPVGAFNVVLNPAITKNGSTGLLTNKIFNEINSLLAVNDVIAGKIDSRSKKHSFLGLTSQHHENKLQLNNQTSRSIVIDGGFAFPKALVRDTIAFAPQIANMAEIKSDPVLSKRAMFFEWGRGLLEDGTQVFTQEPEKVVKWILNNAIATNIEIYDGKGIKALFPPPDSGIKDYEGNELCTFKFLGRERIYDRTLSTYTGTILNYIYECLDKEFYEVFFDTTSDAKGIPYNTLTIRTKPFSHTDILSKNQYHWNWTYWEELAKKAVTVTLDDLIELNLGKDDFNLKNFFRVNYIKSLPAQAFGQYGVSFPTFNINSIKRHGLRELTVNSTILPDITKLVEVYNRKIKSAEQPFFPEIISEYAPLTQPESIGQTPPDAKSEGDRYLRGLLDKRDKIKEWFAFPYYENGSLRMPHNEEVTIGRLINLPDYEYYFPLDGKVYKGIKIYPTDVTHTYSFGQLAETRATVTTGQPDGVVKKWFDHPDNTFTNSPLEKQQIVLPDKTYDKTFYDKMMQTNIDMLTIVELPNE